MKKLLFILTALFLTGCASFNYRVVGWYNMDSDGESKVLLDNGQTATIVGNPRITCRTRYGYLLADGLFVTVRGEYLIVDEWGTGYVYLQNNDLGNYCTFWRQP